MDHIALVEVLHRLHALVEVLEGLGLPQALVLGDVAEEGVVLGVFHDHVDLGALEEGAPELDYVGVV